MSNIDIAKLKEIVDATNSGQNVYIGQVAGQPMVAHKPELIEINTTIVNPNDGTEVLCRATPAASEYLKANSGSVQTDTAGKPAGNYQIMKNVVLPAAKRRGNPSGNGAPAKYPFESMEVGDTFFSGNSEHKKGDAVKALGSTISAQNKKYSKETGETKPVTRAVRDKKTHKAILDDAGNKVTETVNLPVLEYTRKFTIRPVEAGTKLGNWTAPESGAIIGRTK